MASSGIVFEDGSKVTLWKVKQNLLKGIDNNRELRRVYKDFVDDVHDTWLRIWMRTPHPYQTGDYIAHLKKKVPRKYQRIRNFLGKGMPIGVVYNDSKIAHLVEYGTGPDNPSSESPYGPNTPTPEFAPMRKTVSRIRKVRAR